MTNSSRVTDRRSLVDIFLVVDVEVDELSVVIVARAKGHGEAYLPQGASGASTNP